MKKRSFAVLALALFFVPTFSALSQTTKNYGDFTVNGWFWVGAPYDLWDMTQSDLTISFTLDMSGYTPPMWNTEWSLVGVADISWNWLGGMAGGAPAAAQTEPNALDLDDKLNLIAAPNRFDESSYDAIGPNTVVTTPIGNPYNNYGVWFDRDGVDQWQARYWGAVNGGTYNTGGIYHVVVTFHAISPNLGTMFATVNGVSTGFYDTWKNGPPDHYPVGKSITGNLDRLRIFAYVAGENVQIRNLTVTGTLIPEPATLTLATVGYAAALTVFRRRKTG